MTTLLIIFAIALVLSLTLSPMMGRLGIRFGAIDTPDSRKVHSHPIPRIGGVAIFISFMAALIIISLFSTRVSNLLVIDRQMLFLFLGAGICFTTGLIDDFCSLNATLKLACQIFGASLAYWGDIRIDQFVIMGAAIEFQASSYFITIIWFVLFMNAVNLVDGLDGLATGVVFFTAAVMVVLSVIGNNFVAAMLFASLGGATLGFLRYNFNPASVFLGDGGSYFLGYAVAGISILGSVKSQVGAVLLIPLLALGIPMFDTLLSPLRRFVRGKKIFTPDNGHIHHRLLSKGMSIKSAVLFIYGITGILCLLAIVMVNLRDERAGFFLIVLGAGAILFIRKLGYFEYVATDKVYGWFKDMADMTALTRQRRSFLSLQIDMSRPVNFEYLWDTFCQAAKMLEFNFVEVQLNHNAGPLYAQQPRIWRCPPLNQSEEVKKEERLQLTLPLISKDRISYGKLHFMKNMQDQTVNPYTLRRVEQLKNSLIESLIFLIEKTQKD